jgi:LysR family transcriptional activator of mexEF-oprN operon
VDFVVMPDRLHEGEGIMRRTFADFEDAVFFDPHYPLAEGDLDAFCARPQARVALGPDAGFAVDRHLARLGKTRHVALQVSDFDSALSLIRGTNLIATLPQRLVATSAAHLRHVAPPWPQTRLPLVIYWHARDQTSERHTFWRKALFQVEKMNCSA